MRKRWYTENTREISTGNKGYICKNQTDYKKMTDRGEREIMDVDWGSREWGSREWGIQGLDQCTLGE